MAVGSILGVWFSLQHRFETAHWMRRARWNAADSVNRALLLQVLDQPLAAYWKLAQDPCCLNEVLIEGDGVQVQRINDTSHLSSAP